MSFATHRPKHTSLTILPPPSYVKASVKFRNNVNSQHRGGYRHFPMLGKCLWHRDPTRVKYGKAYFTSVVPILFEKGSQILRLSC